MSRTPCKVVKANFYREALVFGVRGRDAFDAEKDPLARVGDTRHYLTFNVAPKPTPIAERVSRAHEFGDGGQQVYREYEQVNHGYGR